MARIRVLAVATGATVLLLAVIGITAAAGPPPPDEGLAPIQQLGKSIFFDDRLSANGNQSCASCHDPAFGFTGPVTDINAHGAVYEGSLAGAFGNRKPPASAYISMSPVLYQDKTGTWIGGAFWDGRATGWRLGSPTAEQAQGPFLNPKEQALDSPATVVARVCAATDYPVTFEDVWGAGACSSTSAYDELGLSIAAYEASTEVNPLSSKWDLSFGGGAKLTAQERQGMAIFDGQGGCKACHPGGKGGLFTDFTYDNLGVPKNPEDPVYAYDPGFIDEGLGGFLRAAGYDEDEWAGNLGKQKVPTLRNVDLRPNLDDIKAYMHNGYFKTLEGVVHFYNTRDVLPTCPGDYTEAQALAADCWPAPEVAQNVNHDELGNLGLSPQQEAALVAYLKTLSDGYTP